jgi:hypothetical protein
VRAMWASLRSPIGSGMGLRTRPLPRLAASCWWLRSQAASSPSPQAPFRRHCRIPCTTLLAHLSLFCCTFSSRTVSSLRRGRGFSALDSSPRWYTVYALRSGLRRPTALHPLAPARTVYVHLRACILGSGRPRNPTPPSTLLHLRAPSASTCASASLPAGVREDGRRDGTRRTMQNALRRGSSAERVVCE